MRPATVLVLVTFLQYLTEIGSCFDTYCITGEYDVLLHVTRIDPIQKARLKSVVSFFSPEDDDQPLKNRIAVFLTSKLTAPLINFNDYNSSSQLVNKIENLESDFADEMRILDLMPENSFKYVIENRKRNNTVLNIILCEKCFISTNTNYKSFSSIISIYTIVFVFTESKITLIKRYKFFHFIPTNMKYWNNILTNIEICDQGLINSRYKIDMSDVMIINQAFNQKCKDSESRFLGRDLSKSGFKVTIYSLLLEHLSRSRISGFLFSVGLCRIPSRESQIVVLVDVRLQPLHMCQRLALSFKRGNYTGFWFQALSTDYDIVTLCEYDMKFFLINCETDFVSLHGHNYVIRNKTFQETSLSRRSTRLFSCNLNHPGELVPYSLVNDGFEDCSYGKDELEYYCKNVNSGCHDDGIIFNKFQCTNTLYSIHFDKYSRRAKHKKAAEFVYISREKRCDGVFDCSDGADEFNCSVCMEISMSDGSCLPSQWFYDESRRNFSFSRSDRPIDFNKLASLDRILKICNTTDCILKQNITFEIVKCRQGNVTENNRNDDLQHYLNANQNVWASRCVYLRGQHTEGIFGCLDLSHLTHCESFTCTEGLFKCPLSYCVPYYMINDGVLDCEDGTDEIVYDLNAIFQPNFFKCRWSLTIIHPVHVCDGHEQCPTGDDELLCTDSCPSGFTCYLGVTEVDDPSQKLHEHFTNDIDIDTRVLNLSGVNLRDFSFDTETRLNSLAEVYLSHCYLNNKNLLAILDSFDIFYNKLNIIDLSYNKDLIGQIDIFGNKLTNLLYLKLSHTGFTTFNLEHDTTRFKEVDLSFSKIQNFLVKTDSPFRMLNLSNTPYDNKQCQSKGFVLDLDLRKTNLKYTAKDIECLKQYKSAYIDVHDRDILIDYILKPAIIYGDSFKLCCVYRGHVVSHECHAPDDSISSCYGLMGDASKRTFIRVASIMGMIGNVAVIIYIFLYHKMFYLCSLRIAAISFSMSEILMSIYLIIVAGVDNYYADDYFIHDLVWRYSFRCKTTGFLALFSYITTNVLILCFTLDHILLLYLNKRHISRFGLVSIVWLISFVLSIMPFLFPDWEIFESNSMCLGLPFFVKHPSGWLFSLFMFVILLLCNVILFVIGFLLTRRKYLETSLSILQYTEIKDTRPLNLLFLFHLVCMIPVCVLILLQNTDQFNSTYMMGLISTYFYPMKCLYSTVLVALIYLVLAVLSRL